MPKQKLKHLPDILPCPRCQHNMHVFMDWETKRNACQCCCCDLKIDLRDWGYTNKQYKDELKRMQASQSRLMHK